MSSMPSPWKHPKSGIYYHRVHVPNGLRETIKKAVIKKSLGTRDSAEAKRLFALMYADTCSLFIQARNKVNPSPKDLAILAERWQESAIKSIEDEGTTFAGHTQDEGKTFDGVAMTNEQFMNFLQIVTREGNHKEKTSWIGHHVQSTLEKNNLLLDKDGPDYRALTRLIFNKFLHITYISEDRANGHWSSLPIKTSVSHDLPLTTESKPQDPYKPRKTNYTSLSRVIESFIAYKQERGDWTIRTLDDVNLIYAQLTEYLGAKRDPETITREDLRGFVSLG